MDRAPSHRKFAAGCVLVAVASAAVVPIPAAHARVATLEVGRASTPLARIDGLRVTLHWPDVATEGTLELHADAIDAGELGYRFRAVRWRCALTRDADGWRCEGKLRARGHAAATLAARWDAGAVQLRLAAGRASFELKVPGSGTDATSLQASQLPLDWLQPLLAARWEQGRLTAGTLDSTLELRRDAGAGTGTTLAGPISVSGLGLDSKDGRVAAAALDATGKIEISLLPDATAIDLALTTRGGELLAGPMYAALPTTPVDVGVRMRSGSAGTWALQHIGWSHPGVLELEAEGSVDPAAASPLRALRVQAAIPALDLAHARYFETLLATLGLAKLGISGAARGELEWRDGRFAALDLDLAAVDVRDGAARFALEGVDGTLRWSADAAAVDSELRWGAARVYQIDLGPASLPLRSASRGLGLRAPLALQLLGGRLEVPRFAWQPGVDARGAVLDVALALQQVELAQLGRALGWPEFPGTLSGRVPAVRYADEVLMLDGGLAVDVFDGRVEIASMTLERPFGVAPTMTADIAFDALDLEPLTGAFGFGEITGRLDGRVRGLRLVDWAPVAFDADLHTTAGAKGPRRISRRAVDDLSRVGGAGIAAGLQDQVLKLFDTFGYARIGITCRLANNVCAMGGLDSSGSGYTIVEGSGLPRITVIGHQRKVDWPVLVARLAAATDGQAPIIE